MKRYGRKKKAYNKRRKGVKRVRIHKWPSNNESIFRYKVMGDLDIGNSTANAADIPCAFSLVYPLGYRTQTNAIGALGAAATATVASSASNYIRLATIFDMFRVKKLTVRFLPYVVEVGGNAFGTQAQNQARELFMVRDRDDSANMTRVICLDAGVMPIPLAAAVRGKTLSMKPYKLQGQWQNTSQINSYAAIGLSFANTTAVITGNVPPVMPLGAIKVLVTGVDPNNFVGRLEVVWEVEFKGVALI